MDSPARFGWLMIALLILAVGLLVFFGPDKAGLGFWRKRREKSRRILCEDALKTVYNEEMGGEHPSTSSVAGMLGISLNRAAELLADMEKRDLVTYQNGRLRLTGDGKRYALHVIRAHRLWERFLAEETGFQAGEWHKHAERLEHTMTPSDADALDARLNRPSHDPHGDPIPTTDGQLVEEPGQPLTQMSVDGIARILHLEDEPANIYSQLVAQGLRPGMELRVLEKGPDHLRFWAGGDEHVLASILAHSVTVQSLVALAPPEEDAGLALSALKLGKKARVLTLTDHCRGAERRRLLDLGFVPGATVEPMMVSPTGDPTAYQIRGTLIALRKIQADAIRVVPLEEKIAA